MKTRTFLVAALVAATLAGCSSDGGSDGGTEPEVNRSPDLQSIQSVDMLAGQSTTRALVATDADEDLLTFQITSNPGFLSIQDEVWNGPVSTATLVIAPGSDVEGSFTGTVRVSDPDGLSDQASVSIEVTRPNQAPQLATMPSVSVNAGETESVQLSATDGDGDQISFSLANNPGFLSIQDVSQNGNTATATLMVAPPDGTEGAFDITVRVSDGRGGTDEHNCHIEVTVQSGTQLFMDWVHGESILSTEQRSSGNVRTTLYGAGAAEWEAVLGDDLDGDEFEFVLWLGAGTGAGQTGAFTASLRIRHAGNVTEVASKTFSVPYSSQWRRFDGSVTGTSGVGVAGDDIILRVSMSGVSEGAILYGADADSHVLVPGDVDVTSSPPGVAVRFDGTAVVHSDGGATYRR